MSMNVIGIVICGYVIGTRLVRTGADHAAPGHRRGRALSHGRDRIRHHVSGWSATLIPEALHGTATGEGEIQLFSSILYFSLVTLTSTGYGDILPIHPIARSLANLESILGQIYPATLIASLMTQHLEWRSSMMYSLDREQAMNILVIGSGGREHALAWAIAGSPLADQRLLRAGQCRHRGGRRMRADRGDRHRRHRRFLPPQPDRFRRRRAEAPLVAGTVDALEAAGIAAFGPSAAAAALEGSKAFMKDFCAREGIPTAAYRRFREAEAAEAYIAGTAHRSSSRPTGSPRGKGSRRRHARRGERGGRCRARPGTVRRGRGRDRRRGFSRGRGGELFRAGRRRDRAAARRRAGPQAGL